MYYEARTHQLFPVADALEAAIKIKTKVIQDYQCCSYKDGDVEIVIVPDGHIDNIFLEVAVLIKNGDGYEQIETITNGWIATPEELADYFIKAVKNQYPMGKADFIIGNPKGNETANFCCGCCGEYFKGNVKEQQKFDQDSGYGICNNCTRWYS